MYFTYHLVGCGMAVCKEEKAGKIKSMSYVITCNYWPQGLAEEKPYEAMEPYENYECYNTKLKGHELWDPKLYLKNGATNFNVQKSVLTSIVIFIHYLGATSTGL